MTRTGIHLVLACLAGCGPKEESERVRIGALLPLTGEFADSGAFIQQALIMAGEKVNEAGGIAGRRLLIEVHDTKSSTAAGLEAAQELMNDPGVLAILGPEDDDLALAMAPLIRENRIVAISGGLVSPATTSDSTGGFMFRTNPSAADYGRALASRMVIEGVRRAAILHASNEYGRALADVVSREFVRLGGFVVAPGDVPGPIGFEAGLPSYQDLLRAVIGTAPNALVLIGGPPSSAAVVREWALLGGTGRWYFAPSLEAEAFVESVPGGAVEGMVGVAPGIGQAGDFKRAFSDRWTGDTPRPLTYFYYDALALLSVAIESAAVKVGGVPSRDELPAHLTAVSRPPGRAVRWDALDVALDAVRSGGDVDYEGASGFVGLTPTGSIEHPTTVFWRVSGDRTVRE